MKRTKLLALILIFTLLFSIPFQTGLAENLKGNEGEKSVAVQENSEKKSDKDLAVEKEVELEKDKVSEEGDKDSDENRQSLNPSEKDSDNSEKVIEDKEKSNTEKEEKVVVEKKVEKSKKPEAKDKKDKKIERNSISPMAEDSGPATVVGVELTDAIKNISITNSIGNPMTEAAWHEDIRLMTDFDLTGKNVKEGDHFSFIIPKELKPKPAVQHFIAKKEEGGETINLADVYVNPSSNADGTSVVKFIFRKNAEGQKNIKGKFFIVNKIAVEEEHQYVLTIKAPDKDYILNLKIKKPQIGNTPDEKLNKWGTSSSDGSVCRFGLRINRMEAELQDIEVIDYIDPSLMLVKILPNTMQLQRVKYNHPSQHGTGVEYTTLEKIPLKEGENLFLENGNTKFRVKIPSAGKNSYYLTYSTTNPNNGNFLSNHAQLIQNETEILKPNGSVTTNYVSSKVKASQTSGVIIESEIKEKIKIVKLDKDTYAPIQGAEFNIKSKDGAFDKNYTTDADGEILTEKLPNGDYIINETKTLPSYDISDENKNIEVTLTNDGIIKNLFNERKKKDVRAIKVWVGGSEPRPTVWFKLYRQINTGAVEEVPDAKIMELPNGVTNIQWSGVHSTDENGNPYTFSVKEVDNSGNDFVPANYSKEENGTVVTNRNIEKVNIPVEKKWVGPSTADVKVKLLADGVVKQEETLNAGNNWKHTFANLAKYDATDGHEIAYTVDEDFLPNYDKSIKPDGSGGFIITNTNVVPVRVSVEKVWVGPAKDSVKVKLLADGVVKQEETLNAGNNWKHTFANIPKYDATDGHEIAYTVDEDVPAGYTKSIKPMVGIYGFIITNTNKETVDVPVEKKWIGPAKDSVKVKLLADGVVKHEETLNAGNTWKHTFAGLAKYDATDGHEIAYTVDEDVPAGYDKSIKPDGSGGFIITNTNKATVDVPVEKVWIGPGKDSVKVRLLADGVVKHEETLNAGNTWKHTFTGLAKYDATDGHEIAYTVDEDVPAGYDKSIKPDGSGGFIITNTNKATVDVPVEKKWIGPGKDSVKVKLLADGVVKHEETLNAGNNWKHTFAGLAKYDAGDGHEIAYTVDEDVPAGYDKSIKPDGSGGFIITNTNKATVEVPVEKKWIGKAADSITIKLLAAGEEKDSATLSEADNWKHKFVDLPKYDSVTGEEIEYTIDEEDVEGYQKTITGNVDKGFVVTNKQEIDPDDPNGPNDPDDPTTTTPPDDDTPGDGTTVQTGDFTNQLPYILGGLISLALLAIFLGLKKKSGTR